MAVRTAAAATLPDLTASRPTKASVLIDAGKMRTSCHTIDIENGDSIASAFEVARLPSHARLHRLSALLSDGIAGLTDVDLGFTNTEGAPDALVDGADLSSTGSVPAASELTRTNLTDPIWKLAGYTADPKTTISVHMTLKAAATAAGKVVADLVYIVD